MYGSETWTLTTAQKNRITAAEMKLLRPLAGYTLNDHKPNSEIRDLLGITGVVDIVDQYREKWHDHVLRMGNHRIPLQILSYRPAGTRSIGRDGVINYNSIGVGAGRRA